MSQTNTRASFNADILTTDSPRQLLFTDEFLREKINSPLEDPVVTRPLKTYWVAFESSLRRGRNCRILLRIVAGCVGWTLLKWVATACGINEKILGAVDDLLRAIFCISLAFVGTSVYMDLEREAISLASSVASIENPMSTTATPPRHSHPVVHADADSQVPQTTMTQVPDQSTEPTSSLSQVGLDEGGGFAHLQMQWTEQRQIFAVNPKHHEDETPRPRTSESGIHPKPDLSNGSFKVTMRRSFGFEELTANPNFAFTNVDQAALTNLRLGLRIYKDLFFAHSKRLFPAISLRLVSIEPNPRRVRARLGLSHTSRTSICVTGLKRPDVIEEFDNIMSREGYKNLYDPLKLCYEQSEIIRSAGSGSYNIDPSELDTFCGSLVVFEGLDGSQRKSTVGGMIEIDGQTFGLTTSHHPEDETTPESDVPSLADLIRAFDADEGYHTLQHVLSSAPLANQQDNDETLGTPALHTSHSNRDSVKGSSSKSAVSLNLDDIWDDWDLLPIEPESRLPNAVPASKSRSKYIYIARYFDSTSFDNAMPWRVIIISGMSGIVDGFLTSSPSYTLPEVDRTQESWNIRLKRGDLQAGDSGSWVVREDDHSLLGLVVARSTGSAYMIPWKQVTQSIERKNNLKEGAIKLPTWSSSWMGPRKRLPERQSMPAAAISISEKLGKNPVARQRSEIHHPKRGRRISRYLPAGMFQLKMKAMRSNLLAMEEEHLVADELSWSGTTTSDGQRNFRSKFTFLGDDDNWLAENIDVPPTENGGISPPELLSITIAAPPYWFLWVRAGMLAITVLSLFTFQPWAVAMGLFFLAAYIDFPCN